MTQFSLPCTVYRGGTSRGLFFHERDLPTEQTQRESIFLKAIGSEDITHINGLGGGSSHTSKVAIIAPSSKRIAHVDYTFVQLGLGNNTVDMTGTCGNLMAAVGAFAVDEKLVDIPEKQASVTVKVWNTNIQKMLNIVVPIERGKAKVRGDFSLPGVHERGAVYLVNIIEPGGEKTGTALPLGAQVRLETENQERIAGSLVDVVNPFVYVAAESLGLKGTEGNQEVSYQPNLLSKLESIREQAIIASGWAQKRSDIKDNFTAIPKIAYVSHPQNYRTTGGKWIHQEDYDILARMVSMGRLHRTFAVSGLFNLAAACLLTGTIPQQLCKTPFNKTEQVIRIGHPEGIIPIRVNRDQHTGKIISVGIERTARRIMSGELFIPHPHSV